MVILFCKAHGNVAGKAAVRVKSVMIHGHWAAVTGDA